MTKYSVISIATGDKYLNYWFEMVKSFKSNLLEINQITFYILTDDIVKAKKYGEILELNLSVHLIPPYRWPEATLMRYKEILNIQDFIQSEILIYLDADMLVKKDFIKLLEPEKWFNDIALVAHPGYWRPKKFELMRIYLKSPKCLIKDLWRHLSVGGLGAWETNKLSKAFVRRIQRKEYVCGGAWFGKRKQLIAMISECSKNVEFDLQVGLIAKWHDESHLNYWSANNQTTILNPSFCFDPTYINLATLPEYIRAVRK